MLFDESIGHIAKLLSLGRHRTHLEFAKQGVSTVWTTSHALGREQRPSPKSFHGGRRLFLQIRMTNMPLLLAKNMGQEALRRGVDSRM